MKFQIVKNAFSRSVGKSSNREKQIDIINNLELEIQNLSDFQIQEKVQKLIKQKEVKPINSQPKNNIIVLPEETKNNILTTKDNKNNKNLSTSGSYLKYEKA